MTPQQVFFQALARRLNCKVDQLPRARASISNDMYVSIFRYVLNHDVDSHCRASVQEALTRKERDLRFTNDLVAELDFHNHESLSDLWHDVQMQLEENQL